MNIEFNYDDQKPKDILNCMPVVYKIDTNNQIIEYYKDMIVDLNNIQKIYITDIMSGNSIIFLNAGINTSICIDNICHVLPSGYNGNTIYYNTQLIRL